MSMVINTNVQATRTHGVYNRNTSAMNEAMTRVATAQKINSAKDGASVYAISERMRSQIRANDQANQNTQNDSALLKTAQGGIGNTISILNTLKERAINAANDSNLNMNRSDIATEVEQLVLQIDDNANKVKFNGRNLLNGAVDTTVGSLNAAGSVNAAATVTENPAKHSTNAIYSFNNLNEFDSSSGAAKAASAANNTLLSLVKSNATSAGDTLFSVGDKITFSWKEDGNLVSKDIVVSDTTAISDVAALFTGNVKSNWVAANTAFTAGTDSPDSNDKILEDTFTSTAKSTIAGEYLIGKQGVSITDFSVSVTYTASNGETLNRVDAQEALSPTGVMQAYTTKTGSNSVWSTNLELGSTNTGLSGGTNDTILNSLTKRGTSTLAIPSTVSSLKVTVNGTDVSVAAGGTVEDLNIAFKNKGLDVRAVLLDKGKTVTYGSDGSAVTNDTGANASALKAMASGLFFVGGDGFDIKTLSIAVGSGSGSLDSSISSVSRVQNRAGEESGGASAALTFFVGGEPNFGIDVSINKMTSSALLGTNAEAFASKFLTKDGAQSALTIIDNALNRALNEQTKLGAIEARLGYTSDNLSTMNENLESTDSVMRDADLAKEMTNYMKYSVLSQSAQYMLAQAGQNAFSVLNLLQA